jgi:GTP-binding protein HflX
VPARKEKAILVGLDVRQTTPGSTALPTTAEESLEELQVLAESAGAEIISSHIQSRETPVAATLIGSGKLTEIAQEAEALQADVVLFDRDLTPTQLRNLEKALPCKVLDRTQLILDIFAHRARTREGQLQVELAQLNYLLPRLTGRGIAMSRLGGGIGTRGPGETQLETDRRRIARRVRKIELDLERVRRHRGVQRHQRQAVPLATVALVGYTNAGKSSLFNRLTGSSVLADARMFATLDPTVRHLTLPSRRRALLSDTVGFIRNLPTTLVKAFRATLEEVAEASLLLHVVDVTSPWAAEHTAHVMEVLREIGSAETQEILVLNKVDLLPDAPDTPEIQALARRLVASANPAANPSAAGEPRVVAVSAAQGTGLDKLLALIDQLLPVDAITMELFEFPISAGAERHLLHEHGRVLEEHWREDHCLVRAEVPASLKRRLREFVKPNSQVLL